MAEKGYETNGTRNPRHEKTRTLAGSLKLRTLRDTLAGHAFGQRYVLVLRFGDQGFDPAEWVDH